MSSNRTIETSISAELLCQLIEAGIETHLLAVGFITHKEELVKLEIPSLTGSVPIKYTIKKPQPVEVTIFSNGLKK